jgi:transcriptional regulator with XRE-family HTH domain
MSVQAPIGFQIRALRKERGWTLAELARRAGTSAPTLHRYESGWERFELATLRKLADALGVRLNVSLETPRGATSEARPTKEELGSLLRPVRHGPVGEDGDVLSDPADGGPPDRDPVVAFRERTAHEPVQLLRLEE